MLEVIKMNNYVCENCQNQSYEPRGHNTNTNVEDEEYYKCNHCGTYYVAIRKKGVIVENSIKLWK
jgi:predicted SprT family Zn-dependent metalloprotease